MPCWELFAAQDEKYRRSVLPAGPVRVAVEAALRLRLGPLALRRARRGEEGGLRRDDRLRRLGRRSRTLYPHFGITAEAVAAKAEALL